MRRLEPDTILPAIQRVAAEIRAEAVTITDPKRDQDGARIEAGA